LRETIAHLLAPMAIGSDFTAATTQAYSTVSPSSRR
jgi:hypothetical protein